MVGGMISARVLTPFVIPAITRCGRKQCCERKLGPEPGRWTSGSRCRAALIESTVELPPGKGTIVSEPVSLPEQAHFSIVLAGGGARGFAPLGVLQELEALGFRPSAVVGVSMGAIVAAAYAPRSDWFGAVIALDTSGFPPAHHLREVANQALSMIPSNGHRFVKLD